MTTFMKLIDDASAVARPASDILKSSCGFEIIDDTIYFVFKTIEDRRGYGTQKVPMHEFDAVLEVLTNAAQNGINKEGKIKTCSEVVRDSLTVNENGEVRFKTESEKGKKPTLFRDMNDFSGFVEELSSLSEKIKSKAEKITGS